jgi:hypothetical protein
MKCTEQEFLDTLHRLKPTKWISRDVDVNTGSITVFSLDTAGECQYSMQMRTKLATAIWQDGEVIKDTDYLFISPSMPLYAYPAGGLFTTPFSGTFKVNTSTAGSPIEYGAIELTTPYRDPPKCVCGAHKVNSSNHSSWCDIQELK